MPRTPSAPAAATSPYPLQSGTAADRDGVKHALAEKVTSNLEPAQSGYGLRIATGAAIGSAAIAAALLFYNRSKSTKDG